MVAHQARSLTALVHNKWIHGGWIQARGVNVLENRLFVTEINDKWFCWGRLRAFNCQIDFFRAKFPPCLFWGDRCREAVTGPAISAHFKMGWHVLYLTRWGG